MLEAYGEDELGPDMSAQTVLCRGSHFAPVTDKMSTLGARGPHPVSIVPRGHTPRQALLFRPCKKYLTPRNFFRVPQGSKKEGCLTGSEPKVHISSVT